MGTGPWNRTNTLNTIVKAKTLRITKSKLTSHFVMTSWKSLMLRNSREKFIVSSKSDFKKILTSILLFKELEVEQMMSKLLKYWIKRTVTTYLKYP